MDDSDLDNLRQAAIDHCEDIAESLLGRASFRSQRERRWGTNGKIRLKLATGRWNDWSTGEWGDMIDLVRREMGLDFAGASDWLRSQLALPEWRRQAPPRPAPIKNDEEESAQSRAERARILYLNARPAGAYGFGYFNGRGLDYPEVLEKQLRVNDLFLHGYTTEQKCLIMPFRDFATLEVVGVHKIALAAQEDGKRVKRSAGAIMGSAMMLGRKGPRLAICEGLETGIGVMMGEPGTPVWCLSGASFMAAFGPIEGVEHLIIYADNDANRAGQDAARDCSALWREHADVTIVTPDKKGEDFADVYRRA